MMPGGEPVEHYHLSRQVFTAQRSTFFRRCACLANGCSSSWPACSEWQRPRPRRRPSVSITGPVPRAPGPFTPAKIPRRAPRPSSANSRSWVTRPKSWPMDRRLPPPSSPPPPRPRARPIRERSAPRSAAAIAPGARPALAIQGRPALPTRAPAARCLPPVFTTMTTIITMG